MKRTFAAAAPSLAAVMLAGCAALEPPAASDEPLENTYWKLTRLGDGDVTAVANQREAHLVLHAEERRVAGSGGCNRLMGSYDLEGEALRFGRLATTMMACPAGMQTERAFLDALEEVAVWEVEGMHLTLSDADGEPLADFEAVHLY
ncbi:META domain-containing protein [Halomonas ramblicola]|uniref:META domain-containing protein n=1 Tax=Halomonas ramblicola TaxID=747349 RepID=UPI0025B3CABD|nr:META domain-containing protein [Halomonas ramblicola]MDN3523578.1 META domain-containing protein [Halomonas ramblicola]